LQRQLLIARTREPYLADGGAAFDVLHLQLAHARLADQRVLQLAFHLISPLLVARFALELTMRITDRILEARLRRPRDLLGEHLTHVDGPHHAGVDTGCKRRSLTPGHGYGQSHGHSRWLGR
jgi:hypothetical protein